MPEPTRVPVVLCFDVEPDDPEVRRGPVPWRGFELLLDRIEEMRAGLTAVTGRPARFAWFLRMDPQIVEAYGSATWAVDRYRARLDALKAAGDAFGVHPHAWRRPAAGERWISDHGDGEWTDHCVEVSFESFARAFGEPCRIVRFGDRFMTARGLRAAARLGARYDLTVEPGAPPLSGMHHAPSTGRIPGHGRAPRGPYRPSREDPREPAAPGDGLGEWPWMIPLTTLDAEPVLPLWRRVARRVRHPVGPRYRPAPLVAELWPGAAFWKAVEEYLDSASWPHLAFAVRTDAPLAPVQMRSLDDKLGTLATLPLARRLEFTTPAGVIASRPVESAAVVGQSSPAAPARDATAAPAPTGR